MSKRDDPEYPITISTSTSKSNFLVKLYLNKSKEKKYCDESGCNDGDAKWWFQRFANGIGSSDPSGSQDPNLGPGNRTLASNISSQVLVCNSCIARTTGGYAYHYKGDSLV